jgi:hypothetical protein
MERQLPALLAEAGITLDNDGDIRSLGFPPERPPKTRKGPRHTFTEEDDAQLREWLSRAEAQGLRIKPKIFDDLEAVVGPPTLRRLC